MDYTHWTNRASQFIHKYDLESFIVRVTKLINWHGERFSLPTSLSEMLAIGENL